MTIKHFFLHVFQEEKFSLALGKFTRMVALVESLGEEKDLRIASPLILAGHLNVALCYLKLGKYPECIDSCEKVREKKQVYFLAAGLRQWRNSWGGGGVGFYLDKGSGHSGRGFVDFFSPVRDAG